VERSSKVKRFFTSLSPEILPFSFLLLVFLLTPYTFLFSKFNIFKVIEMREQLVKVKKSIEKEKEETKKLETLLELAEKNPDYLRERFVREYMQLQKENEKIILFKE